MNPPTSVSNTSPASIEPEPNDDHPEHQRGGYLLHLPSFVLGVVMTGILLGGSLYLLRRPDPPPIVLHPPPTSVPTSTPMPTPTAAPITVFVSGAVYAPGLYRLDAEARVGDALNSAGGISADADSVAVNQAEKLWDGAQIHVPTRADQTEEQGIAANQPPAGVSGAPTASGPATADSALGLINVNAATSDELETLPGIGPSKAAAIISNRPYVSVDDLERVPGIGAKTIDQMRHQITAP